jgi:aspartate/methionine/tyrosine aminotransferase
VQQISQRTLDYRRSAIRVLFDEANRLEGVMRLEIGEPSFVTPQHIIDGAAEAARAGHTGYGPNGGLLSLRELLSVKLHEVNGIEAGVDEIVVCPGGMNALYSTFAVLLEPGDEVLLPTPGFPNMDEMVRLLGGVPVFYHLRPETGFLPDFDELASLVTSRTKVMFTNSPSNPTGRVFDEATVRQVVEFADRNDVWLISDEVYDELLLAPGVRHVPAAWFDTSGRVISVFSFSKVYAMTGWRVGYAVARGDLPQHLRSTQEPLVSCPSTISQKAAEAALTGPREPIRAMRDTYARRLELAVDAAGRSGLKAYPSEGTIYMLLDVGAYGCDGGLDFALDLLREARVSIAPGSVFGPGGLGTVRVSLAAADHVIIEGIERIAAHVQRDRGGS